MALPKAEVANIKAKYVLDKKELVAPIAAHQRVGKLNSTIGINWWRTGLWLRWSLSTKVASSRV